MDEQKEPLPQACAACPESGCALRVAAGAPHDDVFCGWRLSWVAAVFFLGPVLLAVSSGIAAKFWDFDPTPASLGGLILGVVAVTRLARMPHRQGG